MRVMARGAGEPPPHGRREAGKKGAGVDRTAALFRLGQEECQREAGVAFRRG